MEISNNYSSYVTQMSYGVKKQAAQTSEAAKDSTGSTADYLNSLRSLAPSMAFEIGSSLNMKNDGKTNTLTINPKLLEKMQNDPEQARETSELLRGIEQAKAFVDSYMSARGMETKFSHWYVDENGKACHIALHVSKNPGKSFTKEFQKRSDEIVQKRMQRQRMQREIAKKQEAKKASYGKAGQLLTNKLIDSKKSVISLNHKDIQTILAEIHENRARTEENPPVFGSNLDLHA